MPAAKSTAVAVRPKAKVTAKTGPSASALEKFEASFQKSFGPDTLRRTDTVRKDYEVISTGSVTLDFATGVGGYVEGRIHEIWGQESIGKTFLVLLGVIEAQRKHPDKMVFFVDMEQTLDVAFAEELGVDLTRLYHVQPDSAEDVADIVKAALDSDLISMLIVDSIGGAVTEEEFEKDAEDAVVGTMAKVITRMVKIAAVQARKTGAVVLIVNQVRAVIGPRGGTTTGGGYALKHVTTMKFKMSRTATQLFSVGGSDDKRIVGQEVAVQVEKNKVATPKRTAIFRMMNTATPQYGPAGVDRLGETMTVAISSGVIKRRGSKYDIPLPSGEVHTVTGAAPIEPFLREHPDVLAHLRDLAIKTKAGEVVIDPIEQTEAGAVDIATGEVVA